MKVLLAALFAYDPFLKGLSQTTKLDEIDPEEANEFQQAALNVVSDELHQTVMAAINGRQVDSLVVLMDSKSDKVQEAALDKIEKAIGKSIHIEKLRINAPDASLVAQEVIKAIDGYPRGTQVFINVTSLRHDKALGLLYAGCARDEAIAEIFYVDPDTKSIRILPRLQISLTANQKLVLRHLQQEEDELRKKGDEESTSWKPSATIRELKLHRSSFYDCLKALERKGLIDRNYSLTEAGKVLLL